MDGECNVWIWLGTTRVNLFVTLNGNTINVPFLSDIHSVYKNKAKHILTLYSRPKIGQTIELFSRLLNVYEIIENDKTRKVLA